MKTGNQFIRFAVLLDRIHGDVYVSCPYCRSQCEKYNEEEDGEDGEENENDEDDGEDVKD